MRICDRILDESIPDYTAVNLAMVEAYWQIGKRIVQEEQHGEARAEYGKQLIKELLKKLSAEFGRGFAEANIWNFRQFYLTYDMLEDKEFAKETAPSEVP